MAYTEAMNSLIENIRGKNPGLAVFRSRRAWIFAAGDLDFFSVNGILLPI